MDFEGIITGNITGSQFTGNQAVITNVTLPFCCTSATGGAISNMEGFGPGVLNISGSTFASNQVNGGPGGGFDLGGAIINQGPDVTLNLSSSTLIGNRAQGGAGDPSGVFTGGFGTGGALEVLVSSTANVTNSTFIGNSAIGGSDSGAGGQAGPGFGGAIENAATLTLTNCNIVGNMAVGGAATNVRDCG